MKFRVLFLFFVFAFLFLQNTRGQTFYSVTHQTSGLTIGGVTVYVSQNGIPKVDGGCGVSPYSIGSPNPSTKYKFEFIGIVYQLKIVVTIMHIGEELEFDINNKKYSISDIDLQPFHGPCDPTLDVQLKDGNIAIVKGTTQGMPYHGCTLLLRCLVPIDSFTITHRYNGDFQKSNGCIFSVQFSKEKPNIDSIFYHDTSYLCHDNLPLVLYPRNRHADNIIWNTGSKADSLIVSHKGIYSCISKMGNHTFFDTFTVNNPIVKGSVKLDTFICDSVKMLYLSKFTSEKVIWNTGDTSMQIIALPGKNYWYKYYYNCVTFIDSFKIQMRNAIPYKKMEPNISLCAGMKIKIGNHYDAINYIWNTGETTCCIDVSETGYYIMHLNDGCGVIKDTCLVEVVECKKCFFVPTAFTPNQDGINDFFGPIAKCLIAQFRLSIYDRWGKLQYQTDKMTDKWDGKNADIGTYSYLIEYKTHERKALEYQKGNVTLIR